MNTGELLTRSTACAAFAGYAIALALRMWGHPQTARKIWQIGAAVFVLHVVCAFHFAHHWSHADAYAATARQTAALTGRSSGAGLYLNYALLLLWPVHACLSPRHQRGLAEFAVQSFFAFMWFNATVVFGHGFARWLGIAAFTWLAILWFRRRTANNTCR